MSEIAIANGPINGTKNQPFTSKATNRRFHMHDVQTITDLDKGRLYIVDKDRRNYVEMPIESLSGLIPGRGGPDKEAIVFKRTGATHVIAYNHCDEYRGNAGNGPRCTSPIRQHLRFKVAPGADEIVKFDRKMVSQLQGLKVRTSDDSATGMVLEEDICHQLAVAGFVAARL